VKDDVERLKDIRDAIEKIETYAGRGRKAFEADELLQVWAVHHLQIIGEAASKLSEEFMLSHPDVPWSKMIGMRNVLVHDYAGIDLDIVWAAVEGDLPELKGRINSILGS